MDRRREIRLLARMTGIAAAVVLVLLILAGSAHAQTAINVTYTWTTPTSGSPVHHYEVDVSFNAGAAWSTVASPTTNSAMVSIPALATAIVRVRGVDAQDRKGPYSTNSDPYTYDPGPPSAPGKPARIP